MYLEKLEIQGFKSFANKNVLVFPGLLNKDQMGITSVVGPNGSGKSNIADAVRWVLGEQSMKTLRGKKAEDVIFSGSDKKSRLSMAEVSLHLNNEDGRAPIEFAQVVLTRRLYRDGNSEYLLNNSRVRLLDIQLLLARASFGQRTYSVIGQGMVEGFLNTSLGERKEFFDEATGVKQYQIKRDEALNKLLSSYDHSDQARLVLNELEPRLKSLTKQVGKLQRRGELESELADLHNLYYRQVWHEIHDSCVTFRQQVAELEKEEHAKNHDLSKLSHDFEAIKHSQGGREEIILVQQAINQLQQEKEREQSQLSKMEAQLELRLEQTGKFDLAWLKNKQSELARELSSLRQEFDVIEKSVALTKAEETSLISSKNEYNQHIREVNQSLVRNKTTLGDDELTHLHNELRRLFSRLEEAESEQDFTITKQIIFEIKADLKALVALSEKVVGGESLEKIHHQLVMLTDQREAVSAQLSEIQSKLWPQQERKKTLHERENQTIREIQSVESKLQQQSKTIDWSALTQEQEIIKKRFNEIEVKLLGERSKLRLLEEAQSDERQQLFSSQQNIQAMQREVNIIVGRLNEAKVGATRYETKLEDLESEMRQERVLIKDIKSARNESVIELPLVLEKIRSIRRQLEHIGGIDPEVEKEFIEIKERFNFLSKQVDDLTQAIDSLEKIVKELDGVIKERFDKQFKIIAEKFEEYFKILFNGGNAKVIKVIDSEMDEEADDEEKDANNEPRSIFQDSHKKLKYLQKYNATGLAGIEIQATPPGKKIKSITMLSGGERALTAIALICAIIHVNPSPFVVLDEVDAALDEANSERLAKILDDLSHKTQFIVITHNRASMRRANVLYGVTMADDGVSQLLSVKLEDSLKHAK
ncbi:MAG: chromosome segregation SMC family protein [Candidatus Falkowbacteria bacterium]